MEEFLTNEPAGYREEASGLSLISPITKKATEAALLDWGAAPFCVGAGATAVQAGVRPLPDPRGADQPNQRI
jgi:hypothetical protein